MKRRIRRWLTMTGLAAGLLGLATTTMAATAQAATGWTVYPVSPANGPIFASFASSDTNAWAVGQFSSTSSTLLALHWNGTAWSQTAVPDPSAATYPLSALLSVGASSATDAWAVGYLDKSSSATDAWAVGYLDKSGKGVVPLPLYEHWNGTAWSTVSVTEPGFPTNVVDISPTDAWTFGSTVEQWNGTSWNAVTLPVAIPHVVRPDGSGGMWGLYGNATAVHFNGTTWTTSTLASTGSYPAEFSELSVISPTDVWASGCDGENCATPVIDHFNGTSWQMVGVPSSFTPYSPFLIVAQSDSDVWISGYDDITLQTLLANWNGSTWTTSAIPEPASTEPYINDGTSSPNQIWLFGEYVPSGSVNALVLGRPH